jgi:hypothetical protein
MVLLHGAGGANCSICNSRTHSSLVCPLNWDDKNGEASDSNVKSDHEKKDG